MPLLPWLLNVVYGMLLIAAAPWLVYRAVVQGKNREGWREKLLGDVPRRDGSRPCVWFHAVSVGEVLQLRTVLAALSGRVTDLDIVITTTTTTGLAVAKEKYPHCRVCYFPLDFSWAVRRAIRRLRPSAIVLVELELWPNFILAARRARVPLALINGRISERSFRGYRRIRPLMRRLLAVFDVLAVQTPDYAERLIVLGAPPARVHVTGSIKFDHVETDRRNPKTQHLRQAFGLAETERVFIAGSTQSPEEEIALRVWQQLRPDFPDLRLVLVPRHKERFEEVARLVERCGLPLVRRSKNAECGVRNAEWKTAELDSSIPHSAFRIPHSDDSAFRTPHSALPPVLLLDTLGELAACWGLADVAFVGGSLTNRGGQNMIEPAAYGAAVLFGPNTRNFRDVVDVLLAGQAAQVVADEAALARAVRELLAHPTAAQAQGRTAQQLVLAQQGATARTVEHLTRLLPVTGQRKRRAA